MSNERGILSTCAQGHTQRWLTPDMDRNEAEQLAGLLDGTSPLCQFSPCEQAFARGTTGQCSVCHTALTCTLFGYATDYAAERPYHTGWLPEPRQEDG